MLIPSYCERFVCRFNPFSKSIPGSNEPPKDFKIKKIKKKIKENFLHLIALIFTSIEENFFNP